MLSISERAMHCTVRIECVDHNGNSSSGTGFFYNLFRVGDSAIPAIITNIHVIAGSQKGFFHITLADTQGSPIYGTHQRFEIDQFEARWIKHNDPDVDLAMMCVGPLLNESAMSGKPLFYVPVDQTLIRTDVSLQEQLTAAEEITMIGYPNGIWDQVNNIPIIRRGITATPAYINYNGKGEFIIDAACFPGSSGSPVFILNEGSWGDKHGNLTAGNRIIFLGVLHAGPQTTATGEIIVVDIPTDMRPISVSKIMMNLGYCIKARRIVDFEKQLIESGFEPPSGYSPEQIS